MYIFVYIFTALDRRLKHGSECIVYLTLKYINIDINVCKQTNGSWLTSLGILLC